MGRMEKVRVLVANELRSYREAIGEVFKKLRPHVEVHCVEPEELDGEIVRVRPHLVLCSRLTDAVRTLFAWVLLYPDGKNRAEVSTAGERMTLFDVELDHLLSILDKTELLLRDPRAGTA